MPPLVQDGGSRKTKKQDEKYEGTHINGKKNLPNCMAAPDPTSKRSKRREARNFNRPDDFTPAKLKARRADFDGQKNAGQHVHRPGSNK